MPAIAASAIVGTSGNARIGDQEVRNIGDQRDRGEVPRRIDGQVPEDRGVDRDRADVPEEDRVAVGRGLGGRVHGDVARCAGTILDDDRLAEDLGEPRADDPRNDVRRATGGEGNDHPDRTIRVGRLAQRKRRKERQRERDHRRSNRVPHHGSVPRLM
jgi:hypothetical protein